MSILGDLFDKYGSDKNSVHSYAAVYERLIDKLGTIDLLEIGVQQGASLKVWREWFGESVEIFGVDNGDDCGLWISDHANTRIYNYDQCDPLHMTELWQTIGMVDVVIDDGMHRPFAQIASYGALWPHVRSGGLYFIEDITNIEIAFEMACLFNFTVEDLRAERGGRDDNILLWKKKA